MPLAKARPANSPGSARRQPGWRASAASTALTIAEPPWRWNSAMSSPVSLRGAANQRTSPSSSVSPLAGSRMRRNAAMRFFGRGGANASITSPARGPGYAHDGDARPPGRARQRKDRRCLIHAFGLLVRMRGVHSADVRSLRSGKRHERKPPGARDEPLPAPAQGQPRPLVGVGAGSARRSQAHAASRSCCRSATRPATGAT